MHTAAFVVAGLVGVKVWYDALKFMYYRERMRVCNKLVHEGIGLIRFAVDKSTESVPISEQYADCRE